MRLRQADNCALVVDGDSVAAVAAISLGSSLGRLEHEYGSLAAFVVEGLVGGPYLRQLRPERSSSCSDAGPCPDRDPAAAELELGARLGAKVQHPGVRPFEAGVHVADNQAIAIADVKQRDRPRLPGPAPGRGQEQHQRTAGKRQPASGPAVQLWLERRNNPPNRKHSHTSAAQTLGGPEEGFPHPAKRHTLTMCSPGYSATATTAWLAEGLLRYLRPAGAARLLEQVTCLSAGESRLAVEYTGREMLRDSETTAAYGELNPALAADQVAFWGSGEPESDPRPWLESHSWRNERHGVRELARRHGRPVPRAFAAEGASDLGGLIIALLSQPG